MSDHETYITSREATQIFIKSGLSEPTFRRRVKNGDIEKVLPDDKQRGAKYPLSQVLAATKPRPKVNVGHISFHKITPQDVWEIAPVMDANFSKFNIALWKSRIEANLDIGYMVRLDGRVVGCGFIIPHTQELILSILSQEQTPAIHAHDILTYETAKPVCLYIRSVCTFQSEQDIHPVVRRKCAQILIVNMLKSIIDLGKRGVIVEKIYGRSDSGRGEYAMRFLGMTQIPTVTNHKNFVIDMQTSGLRSVLRYHKAYQQWQVKHSGEADSSIKR